MIQNHRYHVIIAGGSYSGLAAGMALGRALRKVLIIDNGQPCNRQTPHSHNFITQDGRTPSEIASLARKQVENYSTVEFLKGSVSDVKKTETGFEVSTASGESFNALKLIFATGIRDIMKDIDGYAECWGISVLHCPYCHGYEVRNKRTGILGNGDYGYEFSMMISNWTDKLTLFTNGKSALTAEQSAKLHSHGIEIVETEVVKLDHSKGYIHNICFSDGSVCSADALYSNSPFVQHCDIPERLGCEFTDEGYIRTDPMQKTSITGVFACGDNSSRIRTVANAVGSGTTAGMMVNKEIIFENF